VLICTRCDVGEVTICAEFHQRYKPMKCVWCDAQYRLNGILQLSVLIMEYKIRLPLFVHVARVPQRTELCDQWFEGFDLRESGSLG
jgi:hypothetical protein